VNPGTHNSNYWKTLPTIKIDRKLSNPYCRANIDHILQSKRIGIEYENGLYRSHSMIGTVRLASDWEGNT